MLRFTYYKNKFKEKTMSIFKETNDRIIIENSQLSIEIAKDTGKVEKAIFVPDNTDVLEKEKAVASDTRALSIPYFSYLYTNNKEVIIPPIKVEAREDVLTFTYENGVSADILFEIKDHFFTAELISSIPKDVNGIAFFNIRFNYTPSFEPESFRASGVSMDSKVNNSFIPGGWTPALCAGARTSIGHDLKGAKMGVVFSKEKDHRAFLKEVMSEVDPKRSVVSSHGGPFALDNDDIFGDYVILFNNITPENAEETAELALKYSLDQIDIHHGPDTFIQGDFNFVSAATEEEKKNGTFITGAMFKERIADKFISRGLQLGLHTYSSTISAQATTITSDPKWQGDFVFVPTTYTLKEDIDENSETIFTNEDASEFKGDKDGITYYTFYTGYVLIDEEIVHIPENGTKDGMKNIIRGALGTKPAPHKKGAKMRQFQGKYGCLQPVPGTELFYHIARQTAKAYNEGGFEMIYFDGYESMYWLLTPENRYYFYTEFVREVLINCKKKPIIEFSTFDPFLWGARGRGNAIDHARRSYKKFKKMHFDRGMRQKTFYYTATLGWMDYAPDYLYELKNTVNKSIFRDDLDHMGTLGIQSDFSTVCMPFSIPHFDPKYRIGENFMYYGVYSRLRKAKYFSEEVKKALSTSPYEHKAVKCSDGSWGMQEMVYAQNKVHGSLDDSYATGRANNPFEEQTPYIRIEERYSAISKGEKTVFTFDSKNPADLVGVHEYPETDISGYRALKINVKGNGSKDGAVLLKIEGKGNASGWTEFLLPLSHVGNKEFILIDTDNADYDGYDFPIGGYAVHGELYRWFTNLARLTSVTVSVTGNTEGAEIGDLVACKLVNAPVKNPTVTVGDKSITFNTEIGSGEYIEYYPEKNKAYLYSYEKFYEGTSNADNSQDAIKHAGYVDDNASKWVKDIAHTSEITFEGEITIPKGEYSFKYDAKALTSAPTRALVKIGMAGNILKNPEGFNAPEVDMPEDILDVIIK